MNKRIVILGSGESGTGAAVLAKTKGFDVFISDNGTIKDKYRIILNQYNITFEESKHSEALILNAGEVIKSPGIPDDALIVKAIHNKNIKVISEIEFAARFTNAKKICITGSNGKTTTTLLTHHIFQNAGLNVGLVGNIRKSFALDVALNKRDFYVMELSSFQLDGMFDFKADVAVLLNITPDHLNRYEYKFQNYIDSKFRIIQNQTKEDAFIYCSDDTVISEEVSKRQIHSKCFPFSFNQKFENGAFLINNKINIKINNSNMTIETLALQGKHNVYNSMAAGIAAKFFDIKNEVVKDSVADFRNVEHRLEMVANIHGIEFINDSKATNVNSVWWALETMTKPVIWIAGGEDKGNDYSMLSSIVKSKVKAIICLGVNNKKLVDNFKKLVNVVIETKSMNEAVKRAYDCGKPGDVVLLSPACASFDLFEDYEDRGWQFKTAVRNF